MRIVFMGTPEIAATVLASLMGKHDIVGVFTRPDAVRGRGKKLVASPVKELAGREGLPVFEAASLRDEQTIDALRALEPDCICVVAYGVILPLEVLDIPRFGCFNVHTSLLPRWRGAAPMQRAILAGDEHAGVCIMNMEEGLDTGAWCKRFEIKLDGLYLDELEGKLALQGAQLLVEALNEAENGSLTWTEQDESQVTYADKIEKGELDLDPRESSVHACAKVRASDVAHPVHAVLAGKPVIIEKAQVLEGDLADEIVQELEAGQLVFRAKRLIARASEGVFEIEQLKPQGKKSMEARAFAAGIQGIKNKTLTWGRA